MIGGLLPAIAMALLPAQFDGLPLMTDARIQVVSYVADQVVPLRVATGYAAVVEFAADERIENVVVGNSAAWQVTANGAGDRLVVKPLTTAAPLWGRAISHACPAFPRGHPARSTPGKGRGLASVNPQAGSPRVAR